MKKLIGIILILVVISTIIFLLFYKDKFSNEVGSSNKSIFEAKISNETVFNNSDVIYIGKSKEEAFIESCLQLEEGYDCKFSFVINISSEAAKRHAEITSKLKVNLTRGYYLDSQNNKLFPLNNNSPIEERVGLKRVLFLDKPLDLYLDGKLIDSLWIPEDLKGKEIVQIIIPGTGYGTTTQEAYDSAQENMIKMQSYFLN